MKSRTDDEIKNFINTLFNPKTSYDRANLKIKIARKGSEIFVNVTKMYESPGCGFPELKKLAEFFETDNIDKYDDISEQGCETCDYGSSYGFALRIWK